jgi:hypothetical protein
LAHRLTEMRWQRQCENGAGELPSMRRGTNDPASCAELQGCSRTYSRRRESHWEGCHRRRPKGEKQGMGGAVDRHGQEAGSGGGTDNRSPGGGGVLIVACARAKWAMAGACTWVHSVLCAAMGQGRARLAAGDASVKETRSCTACLLHLSRWARWQDAEQRRPRGGGAHDRGGVGCMHACMHCPDVGV